MTLPRATVLSYGLSALGYAAVGIMVATYLPEFYADSVGVPLSLIGLITTVLQTIDAVTDPVFGHLSDGCSSKYGRRRPFVLVGNILLSASFVAIFSPPTDWSQELMIAWVALVGFVLFTTWTVARVPYMSWGMELSPSYDEKTRISVCREIVFVLGAMSAAVLPQILKSALGIMDEFKRMAIAAWLWAVIIWATTTVSFVGVPDPPLVRSAATESSLSTGRTSSSSRSMFSFIRQIVGNRTAVIFYVNYVFFNCGLSVNALMFPFFVKHVVKEEDMISIIIAGYITLGVLFIPVWYRLSLRFEKKPLYLATITVQVSSLYITAVTLGEGDLVGLCLLVVFAGTSYGGSSVLKYAILSDVADVECLRSGGFRDEGKLFSILDVSSKLLSAIVSAACFGVIDMVGYVEGADQQTASTKTAMVLCYAVVPGLLGTIAIVVMMFYPLNRAGHLAVMEKLAALEKAAHIEDSEKGEVPTVVMSTGKSAETLSSEYPETAETVATPKPATSTDATLRSLDSGEDLRWQTAEEFAEKEGKAAQAMSAYAEGEPSLISDQGSVTKEEALEDAEPQEGHYISV